MAKTPDHKIVFLGDNTATTGDIYYGETRLLDDGIFADRFE